MSDDRDFESLDELAEDELDDLDDCDCAEEASMFDNPLDVDSDEDDSDDDTWVCDNCESEVPEGADRCPGCDRLCDWSDDSDDDEASCC